MLELLSVDKKKVSKTEMPVISSFTVRETKRFFMFKTVDKNGNADNKGLASMLADE
jgi:hypothetical protein